MGCGKTTIGKQLKKLTGYKLIDMDLAIQKEFGMMISEFFEKFGEKKFRETETETLKQLLDKDNQIIATGGGVVVNRLNVDLINSYDNAILVYIDTPLRALQERLKNDTKRPLLQRPDRYEFIATLHNSRHPIYKQAAKITVSGGAPINFVAKNIKKLVFSLDKV